MISETMYEMALARAASVVAPHSLNVYGAHGALCAKEGVYLDELCVQNLRLVVIAAQRSIWIEVGAVLTNHSPLHILVYRPRLITN